MSFDIDSKDRRIDYVTDLQLTAGGGGSFAVNANAYRQLERCFEMKYLGPIVPRPPRISTLVSKFKRHILKRRGRFTYFSEAALNGNARAVAARLDKGAAGVVFRSAARWSHVKVDVPYYIYLDAVFHTFFHNTFRQEDFDQDDLARIFEREAAFLEGATAVFFESRWGMRTAKDAYSLKGTHYLAVGRGGVLEPPKEDAWDGQSKSLVTIAMNFKQKGGDVALEAYRTLKHRFPSVTWHIIGGEPSDGWEGIEGITYEGVLNPEIPSDRRRLEAILANAFLLIHPTREDTSPLVITEAAYFGVPAVSTNSFAIPELITHGVSGILINMCTADEVVSAVSELMENEQRYRDMRHNARALALSGSRWESVGSRMCDHIAATLRA
jgi:glycosyltransferase involved in cell wall biosynthesis